MLRHLNYLQPENTVIQIKQPLRYVGNELPPHVGFVYMLVSLKQPYVGLNDLHQATSPQTQQWAWFNPDTRRSAVASSSSDHGVWFEGGQPQWLGRSQQEEMEGL
jgi:hypothetical protein